MEQGFVGMVLDILKGEKDIDSLRKYYLYIKRIVARKVRRYFPYSEFKELEAITEDITQDFFLWLLRESNRERFLKRKERLTAGYLLKKIDGLVIDYLRKADTLQKHIPFSVDETFKNQTEKGESKETHRDKLEDKNFVLERVDWEIAATALLRTLEKKLNEEQMKTLCHWIFRDKYSTDCFLDGLSPAAKYKRVERLKKALKEILEQNPVEVEEWKTFIELMELYCQKRFGKCV